MGQYLVKICVQKLCVRESCVSYYYSYYECYCYISGHRWDFKWHAASFTGLDVVWRCGWQPCGYTVTMSHLWWCWRINHLQQFCLLCQFAMAPLQVRFYFSEFRPPQHIMFGVVVFVFYFRFHCGYSLYLWGPNHFGLYCCILWRFPMAGKCAFWCWFLALTGGAPSSCTPHWDGVGGVSCYSYMCVPSVCSIQWDSQLWWISRESLHPSTFHRWWAGVFLTFFTSAW